jgi:hypothetical protein
MRGRRTAGKKIKEARWGGRREESKERREKGRRRERQMRREEEKPEY